MFEGNAEEAMTFYISLFDDAEVVSITRYGADGPGPDGSVQQATFSLAGQQYMCIDSPANYGFSRKFGWVNDQFGVSWQLNLAA